LISYSSFLYPPSAPTQIYTLSLHDALPISIQGQDVGSEPGFERSFRAAWGKGNLPAAGCGKQNLCSPRNEWSATGFKRGEQRFRSEEHTSELQSRFDLVCRLLLEKKKTKVI